MKINEINTSQISRTYRCVMGMRARLVEDDQGRIQVVAKDPADDYVSLGSISAAMFYGKDQHAASMAIERIKFWSAPDE